MNLAIQLQKANEFIQEEFSFNMIESKLALYSYNEWIAFCEGNALNKDAFGVYAPNLKKAYIRSDSPHLVSDAFHEYFGHGLFLEQSLIGKELSKIIEEKSDENSFLYEKINPKKQPFGIYERNIHNYEGFATWLEELLCKETSNEQSWKKKEKTVAKEYLELKEYFTEVEKQMTRFGLLAQLGFPKLYDGSKVVELTKKIYGNKFKNIEFIVLYGSLKPYSDIDLFVVSNNKSHNYFNGWLDIYEVNKNEFNKGISHFDISMVDPLFSGTLIYGNKKKFEKQKRLIKGQGIQPEHVIYNLERATEQKNFLKKMSENTKQKRNCFNYMKSFEDTASMLYKGIKTYTYQELKNHNEKKC